MNSNMPTFISVMFLVVTLATFYFIYSILKTYSNRIASTVGIIILVWLILTGWLAYKGFYLKIDEYPYRFFLAAPVVGLTIVILLINRSTRQVISNLSPTLLHYLSIIRIPVELVLWWMFIYGQIPGLMTFEGRNFDILAGITAPFVAYFCFQAKKWPLTIAWIWNIISLLLLLNIIINAALSAPTPFQQQAFDQSSIGIFYFPIIWLPAFVAPAVLFSHLANFLILRKLASRHS